MSHPVNSPPAEQYRASVIRKIKFRVLPFLVVLYIMAFIDRANVGYAALEMNEDLGITKGQFGLACAMGVVLAAVTLLFAALVFLVSRLLSGKDDTR